MSEDSLEAPQVNLLIRGDGDVTLRSIGLGIQPVVLIEATEDGSISIDASFFDTQEDLAELFEYLTLVLRQGEEV